MNEYFLEIAKSNDLKDITTDIVETVLDNSIQDEILKAFPVTKTILAFKNIYSSISDRLFIKKAMIVLLELGEIDEEKRNYFINELDDDFCKGSEKLLLSIEKLETYEKCKIFGKLCKLRALGKIEASMFLQLTKVLQDAFLDNLYNVKWLDKVKKNEVWEGDYNNLIILNLAFREQSEQKPVERYHQYEEDDPEFTGGDIHFYVTLTKMGEILQDIYDDLFDEY